MRFLLDQGLPRTAASRLRGRGFDAVHTAERGLSTASDLQILQRARDEERIVVTLDADFHAIMALSGSTKPSVIRVRLEGLRAEAYVTLLEDVIASCAEDLNGGALISVRETGIGIRQLPVGHPHSQRS